MTELYTDINKITADLQLKAEKDLSNITASAKSNIAGYGMPSGNYVDLTLGASGSNYTAPANGYITAAAGSWNAGAKITLYSADGVYNTGAVSSAAAGALGVMIPIRKNQVFAIIYENANINIFRFFYAEGEAE